MKALLKTPIAFKVHFRYKDYYYKAKSSIVLDLDDEEEASLYRHIRENFRFAYPIKREVKQE